MTFDVLSISLGFLVPVGVLVFCNCCLICSLKQSNHMARPCRERALSSIIPFSVKQFYSRKSVVYTLRCGQFYIPSCQSTDSLYSPTQSYRRTSVTRHSYLSETGCKTVLTIEELSLSFTTPNQHKNAR